MKGADEAKKEIVRFDFTNKCEHEYEDEIQIIEWVKMPVKFCKRCPCYQFAYLENLQKNIGGLDEFWVE